MGQRHSHSRASACPLTEKIPPEIRMSIYSYVWNERRLCQLQLYQSATSLKEDRSSRTRVTSTKSAQGPELLRTCRAIYHEASPALYDMTSFVVWLEPSRGLGWETALSRKAYPFLRLIRHLDVDLRYIPHRPLEQQLMEWATMAAALERAQVTINTLRVFVTTGPRREFLGSSFKDHASNYIGQASTLGHDLSKAGAPPELFTRMLDEIEFRKSRWSNQLESPWLPAGEACSIDKIEYQA